MRNYSGAAGGGDVGNFWKSQEMKVMMRALDFTVEPDHDYRYRARIVVFNPNRGRDDVNSGVDTKAKELCGPWSQATNEVHMPADVAAYAMGTVPPSTKSDIKVKFQVIKFNPEDGVTVPRNFDAGTGEVIGEFRTADVPVSDGSGKKSKPIDFNAHLIVLDAVGGWQPMPDGIPGALERPVTSLLLRPDGSVLARNQADDLNNEIRKDIERNYAREIRDSNKKRNAKIQ
jgi:hypothetical protein